MNSEKDGKVRREVKFPFVVCKIGPSGNSFFYQFCKVLLGHVFLKYSKNKPQSAKLT